MAIEGQGVALRQVRALFETGTVGTLTDRQLLERFERRDGGGAETAFAALVERHGPMVLRVCRRSLNDTHAAQDAFQATFLVLVRKAGSLRAHDSLGPWLHAVACRVSACARSAEARRKSVERKAAEPSAPPAPSEPADRDDLGRVVHEEIDRLPERFRAAVVLCDLEGLTQDQAARQLGWPPGTVRSRLARGRTRLQARLTRRGLAPSAGALAGLLAAESASAGAAVPASLTAAAARTAVLVAAGQWKSGAVGVSAAILSEGVLRAMLMTRVKVLMSAILLIGGGAGGPAVLAYQQADGKGEVTRATGVADQTDGGPAGVEALNPVIGPDGRAMSRLTVDVPPDDPEIQRAEAELKLAEADLKRAEDRVAWAEKMREKGYVSTGQLAGEKLALQRAKFALEQAKANRNVPGSLLTPGTRRIDSNPAAELEMADAEIALAEEGLKRAEERVGWATKMVEKGYVTKTRLQAETQAKDRAQADLRQAKERKRVLKTYYDEDKTAEVERAKERIRFEAEFQLKQIEIGQAMARLDRARAVEILTERRNSRRPGVVSELEAKRGATEAAISAAELDVKKAELWEFQVRSRRARGERADIGQTSLETVLLRAVLETARAELKAEQARLELALADMAINAVKKTNGPGPVSEANARKAESDVAAAAANCDRKRAEVRKLERQLSEER